jgi:hypothetical protein
LRHLAALDEEGLQDLEDRFLREPAAPAVVVQRRLIELAARAGNSRFWLLSALRAHTKTP